MWDIESMGIQDVLSPEVISNEKYDYRQVHFPWREDLSIQLSNNFRIARAVLERSFKTYEQMSIKAQIEKSPKIS